MFGSDDGVGVGIVGSSPAELEDVGGSVPPPSPAVPISVNSSPLTELFSGSVPSGVGIVGSPPAKTEDVGGAVPPSSSVVPFSASSYPQPKTDSGLVPAPLGPVASLVSADKASVVYGEAVTVWAGLDSLGTFPNGVVPSVVLPVPIFSPQSPPEDSLVAVSFTHTSLEFFELGQRSHRE